MKFMQRAVSSTTSSPDNGDHSAKKRKLGHSTPEGRLDLNIDEATIKAAMDSQEARRQAALAQHTSGADTHWVLNNKLSETPSQSRPKPALNIVYVGYGDIDSSNESGDNEDVPTQGRTSTRNHKKGQEKTAEKASQKTSNEEDGSSDEESGDEDETTPKQKRKPSSDSPYSDASRSRSRSRSQTGPTKESIKAKEFREKRRKKEVQLSKLTSISSGGGPQFSKNSSTMTCYKCQQTGHKAADCPNAEAPRGRGRK